MMIKDNYYDNYNQDDDDDDKEEEVEVEEEEEEISSSGTARLRQLSRLASHGTQTVLHSIRSTTWTLINGVINNLDFKTYHSIQ